MVLSWGADGGLNLPVKLSEAECVYSLRVSLRILSGRHVASGRSHERGNDKRELNPSPLQNQTHPPALSPIPRPDITGPRSVSLSLLRFYLAHIALPSLIYIRDFLSVATFSLHHRNAPVYRAYNPPVALAFA